jgi:hypothetical protein
MPDPKQPRPGSDDNAMDVRVAASERLAAGSYHHKQSRCDNSSGGGDEASVGAGTVEARRTSKSIQSRNAGGTNLAAAHGIVAAAAGAEGH